MEKIVYYTSPYVMAPFGIPDGWESSNICVENNSHTVGVLIRNKTTGVFSVFFGRAISGIGQKFAREVWDKHMKG